MSSEDEFSAHMKALEEQLLDVEQSCAPETLGAVRALVRTVLDVHRFGLREMLDIVVAHRDGEQVLRALCDRPRIASLLLMHELHPDNLDTRIEHAVREVNDSVSGQSRVSIVRIDGLHVQLRIDGGPLAAARVLRRILERVSCERAPDASIEIDGGEPARAGDPSGSSDALIPVSHLYTRTPERHG